MEPKTTFEGQIYRNILIESQIFPPLSTMAWMIDRLCINIEAYENFQKRSFRNRYQIGTAQGLLELSIPLVKGKNQNQKIQDVKISYTNNWPLQHIRTLQAAYGKSAYFIYYKDLIFDQLLTKQKYLFDFNLTSLKLIHDLYNFQMHLEVTQAYKVEMDSDCLDLRNRIGLKSNLIITRPAYFQVFAEKTGFIANLSILDLLFHQGPEGIRYLQQLQKLFVTKDSLNI